MRVLPVPKRLGVILLLGRLAVAFAAEGPPCTTRVVLANVTDQKGNLVTGLHAEDFRGKYRGREVRILNAAYEIGARRIVVLIDASGSMSVNPAKWEATQALAADITRPGSLDDSFALMVFASDVQYKLGFAEGRAAIVKRAAEIQHALDNVPKGKRKTALYDAILKGLGEFGTPRRGDVIYVITDGGENKSQSDPSHVERALVDAGVRLFVTMIFDYRDTRGRTQVDEDGILRLQQMVARTGGTLYTLGPDSAFCTSHHPSNRDLLSILPAARRLYLQMENFYEFEVEIPLPVDKPRGWELQVIDKRGKVKRDLNLAYQRRLYPCSVSSGTVQGVPYQPTGQVKFPRLIQ